MFFHSDYYKSALDNLPGVVDDEKALTDVLKNYNKKIINNSTNVLKDLQQIVHDCEQKEFERIHFHFSGTYRSQVSIHFIVKLISGHGKDNVTVLTEENENPPDPDLPLSAQNSSGECVLGISNIATSIHDIKVELNKMNTQKITMTLDCCRNVSRGAEAFVVYLK